MHSTCKYSISVSMGKRHLAKTYIALWEFEICYQLRLIYISFILIPSNVFEADELKLSMNVTLLSSYLKCVVFNPTHTHNASCQYLILWRPAITVATCADLSSTSLILQATTQGNTSCSTLSASCWTAWNHEERTHHTYGYYSCIPRPVCLPSTVFLRKNMSL